MKKCPNCGRATERTADWACQWCGYPLLSNGYRTLDKTFRQLQEERGFLRQPLTSEEPSEEEGVSYPRSYTAPEPEEKDLPEAEEEVVAEAEEEPEETEEPAMAEEEQEPVMVEEEEEVVPEPEPPPPPKAAPKKKAKAVPPKKAAPAPEPPPPAAEEPEEPPPPAAEAETEPEPAEEPEAIEPERAPEPPPVTDFDASAEVVELHVRDLNAIYESDKAAAGAKLTGKVVRVTGTVDRIVVNSGLNIFYVLLTSSEPKSWNVRCVFNSEHGSELKRLVKGREATVQGMYGGYSRNILLKDCFLV